jgi:hypothetical protein
MDLIIDSDLKAVAEFMQRNLPVTKLVPVADALAAIAPILWASFEAESVAALRLREPAIIPCAGHKPEAST